MMKEQISALLDDEIDAASSEAALDRLRRDEELRRKWSDYCMVGDALRGEAGVADEFTARVMMMIDAEPTVLAPVRTTRDAKRRGSAVERTMPLVASMMGVAAVGWIAYTLNSGGEAASAQPLALTRAPVVSTVALQTRGDAGLSVGESHREYVFVHQALSGSGPMPDVTQYVRTVAEQPADLAQ